MRTAHLVLALVLALATRDANSGRGLGAHSVDALESGWCLESGLDIQRRAQSAIVGLSPGEGVANRHLEC